MVRLREWDEIHGTLARWGTSGIQSPTSDPHKLLDEHARQITQLTRSVRQLIAHQRFGPDWENSFDIRADESEAVTRLVKIQHDFGYVPNHFLIVRQSNALGERVNRQSFGKVRITRSTDATTTFQFDEDAVDSLLVVRLVPFRGEFIPVGANNA